jgi:hypothetical protein
MKCKNRFVFEMYCNFKNKPFEEAMKRKAEDNLTSANVITLSVTLCENQSRKYDNAVCTVCAKDSEMQRK